MSEISFLIDQLTGIRSFIPGIDISQQALDFGILLQFLLAHLDAAPGLMDFVEVTKEKSYESLV